MSSSFEFSNTESKQICRVCRASGDNVYAMNNSDIFAYRNIVPTSNYKVVYNYSDMFICVYCSHLLRKVQKFVQQCIRAEDVLCSYEQDSKSLINKLHNFTITTTTHKFPDDDVFDEDDNGDDEFDRDLDDDIPLVMLKSEEPVKKRKRLKKEKSEETLESIKTEPEEVQNTLSDEMKKAKKGRKWQKAVKEGFSTRMVQETDEYVVIKFTKEQVLEEMERRSKTVEYQRSLYKCELCVKGFNFEDVLLAHMQKHTPENGTLKCEICAQYCPSVVSLRGHMKSHTTRYSCKVCGISRGSRQHLLEHHAIEHTGRGAVYRCTHCEFTSNKRTVMQRHTRSHAAAERHACHRCGELFKSLETLRVHTARHDKSRLLRCAQCPQSFMSPAVLRRHERAAHELRDCYCVECDLRFKSPENLRVHFKKAKRHRDTSSYKHECPHCSQRFVAPSSLAGHLSTAHGEPKQHSCDICRREYSTRSAARAHMRSAHAHMHAHTCRVCARGFTRKTALSRSHLCGACADSTHGDAATQPQKQDNSLVNEITQIPSET